MPISMSNWQIDVEFKVGRRLRAMHVARKGARVAAVAQGRGVGLWDTGTRAKGKEGVRGIQANYINPALYTSSAPVLPDVMPYRLLKLTHRSTAKRTTCTETASPSGSRKTEERLAPSSARSVRSPSAVLHISDAHAADYFTGVGIFFDT